MSALPAWVIDTVIALQAHQDEHPKFYAEYYPDYEMRPAATCGCEPLGHVPDEVLVAAEAVRQDRLARAEVAS